MKETRNVSRRILVLVLAAAAILVVPASRGLADGSAPIFSWGPMSGPAPLMVRFSASIEGAEKYTWTFTDGTPPVSGGEKDCREVLHLFRSPGVYGLTLKIDLPGGGWQTQVATGIIIVTAPAGPVATLYWCNAGDNTIRMCSSDKETLGQSTVLAHAPDVALPTGLVIRQVGDARYIAWANYNDDTIRAMQIGPTPSTTVSKILGAEHGVNKPSGMHLVETTGGYFLYWANQGDNTIKRVKIAASGISGLTTIVKNTTAAPQMVKMPTGIQVVGNYLYWANTQASTIRRCSLSGPFPVSSSIIVAGPEKTGVKAPVDLRVVGSTLYWTQWGDDSILRCSLSVPTWPSTNWKVIWKGSGDVNPSGLIATNTGGLAWSVPGDNTICYCAAGNCQASVVVAATNSSSGVALPGFMRWLLE